MAEYFAVADVGSNALRFQLAAIEQPGSYRIIEQDRRPIRLGREVFRTGKLSRSAVEAALETLSDFKAVADRYDVKSFRAVATAALREATDASSIVAGAKTLGVALEVISAEEEARLISLGVMSGLRFDLPLGLFFDIGGGSVEAAIANRSNTFCLFSLPLGAVRLTERFLRGDPPANKEIKELRRFAKRQIAPMAERVGLEKFTMAFGTGGSITTLADTDAQLSGESRAGSLTVLRRTRLERLLALLERCSLSERVQTIVGDPKRADIIVAGAAVLLALMKQVGLDYIFVSNRGLRDGLMIDLLQNEFPGVETAWREDDGKPETLEQIGEKYHYDVPHAYQVSQLALSLFYQLEGLHKLPEKFAAVLHAAAMLHDVGLFIGYPKHHKHSYYIIKSCGPVTLSKSDWDLAANIARYHRKAHPSPKHLPFGQLSPTHQDVVRKLSALLRIADGLDRRHESRVKEIVCAGTRKKSVEIKVSGPADLKVEIEGALDKSRLLNEVFNVETRIQQSNS
ncbi:MAG TPA: Ppx/GppA phosphatase family protein [Verrucomicrobiae bacterium]|jgi:exopolyphosphatase/guanosine-5'-triphosphate,3'-diphosphate pyrophosphatase|nr:Ppx/GppA phosphatase family protein [Verrucomicrobiae bacterium]